MELNPDGKLLSRFTVHRPEVIEKLLLQHGYKLSNFVTIDELTQKTYEALNNDDEAFEKSLRQAMTDGGFSAFIGLAVTVGLAIASSISASAKARKARDLQAKIALAQMENSKLIAEEEIRVFGEIERTRILANTLQQYRSNLQSEATKRQKTVYVYLIGIGLGIAVLYGTTILLKDV
tara:strand:- start:511 stop:1044 length:534 start_codon:yes stop_codon:yes gene_type:complete